MKRREFIALIGGGTAASALPFAARAAQPAPVIGLLSSGTPASEAHVLGAFQRGLRQAGYVEGQNLRIEYRWAQGRFEKLPAMAADLVRRQVALIATTAGTVTALAAKAATGTIPILFVTGGDPVKSGLVASLSHPGGNITGVSLLSGSLDAKRLELLHEVIPKAAGIAFLRNPDNPNSDPETGDMQAAAQSRGLSLHVFGASNPRDLDAVYATLVQRKAGGLVVGTDPFLNAQIDKLVALAARHKMPAIYGYREFAASGGLMSYGTSAVEARRQLGLYAARILKGEKPADLPVQQATKVELILNLKTATALRLNFPITVLGRADEAIE